MFLLQAAYADEVREAGISRECGEFRGGLLPCRVGSWIQLCLKAAYPRLWAQPPALLCYCMTRAAKTQHPGLLTAGAAVSSPLAVHPS